MKAMNRKWRNCIFSAVIGVVVIVMIVTGPVATTLQLRSHWAPPAHSVDVVYLVCGARAQGRRLQTLKAWLAPTQRPDSQTTRIWIGNDTQNSLWSRKHQRNLTRAEWATRFATNHFPEHEIKIVPGAFTNTDGEMHALAKALQNHADIQTIALVTCGFHARRTVQRFTKHADESVEIMIIPVIPHWENRAPWIVLAEWLKMIRDHFNLTHHPWVSRQA